MASNRRISISIIIISGTFTLWILLLAWKLYSEFACPQADGDLNMRRRFLHFEVNVNPSRWALTYAISCLCPC